MTSNSKQNRQKTLERRQTSFLKEQVENADLYKSPFTKIMKK